MNFNNKIYELRKEKNISQEKLAEKLNVSRQAVAKWENGESFPDIDNLIMISNLFNISIDRLVKNDNCITNVNKEDIYIYPFHKLNHVNLVVMKYFLYYYYLHKYFS